MQHNNVVAWTWIHKELDKSDLFLLTSIVLLTRERMMTHLYPASFQIVTAGRVRAVAIHRIIADIRTDLTTRRCTVEPNTHTNKREMTAGSDVRDEQN